MHLHYKSDRGRGQETETWENMGKTTEERVRGRACETKEVRKQGETVKRVRGRGRVSVLGRPKIHRRLGEKKAAKRDGSAESIAVMEEGGSRQWNKSEE